MGLEIKTRLFNSHHAVQMTSCPRVLSISSCIKKRRILVTLIGCALEETLYPADKCALTASGSSCQHHQPSPVHCCSCFKKFNLPYFCSIKTKLYFEVVTMWGIFNVRNRLMFKYFKCILFLLVLKILLNTTKVKLLLPEELLILFYKMKQHTVVMFEWVVINLQF